MTHRIDPLETARQIETSYKRYLKTLLAPRDERLADAFDATITSTKELIRGPILELTPPYETGATARQLIDEQVLHPGFARLDSPALPIDQRLYVHQETAIRKFLTGRNLVVSTGTGSGKTESFLVPILNTLIEEHADGTLGPGVRALLLYPMNALANDQLKRIRNILTAVPEITFGRYTGETLPGRDAAEKDFLQNNPGLPRLPNELLSRDEMRASPPHLLLTNYAMLEYLLLRPGDIDLFDGPYAGTWRFIVMDEAHVYDGAQGSEVAMLLRRLKQRVAPKAELQCIATSASLTGSAGEAMTFAGNLFDATFEYEDDDASRQDLVEPTRKKYTTQPTWKLTGDQILQLSRPGADLDQICRLSGNDDIGQALHTEQAIVDLKNALSAGPRDVRQLQDELWPDDPQAADKLDALVALGSEITDSAGHPVLSARYHLFVRATEGAFVSFADDGPQIFLGRHEVDPDTGRAVFEFGTCNRCGAVHLAGEIDLRGKDEYFVPTKKADSSVRWLVLADADADTVVDEDEQTLAKDAVKLDSTTRRLCTSCGFLADAGSSRCGSPSCGSEQTLLVREHARKTRVMSRCTECGTQSRQGIRRLRTDTNAAPAVVTTALYQQLPEAIREAADQAGSGRKLLMFSDSRQAAAFAAPYLDRTYSRMLERRYITQALQDPDAGGGDLTLGGLATLTREKAEAAKHFPPSLGGIEITKAVNQWLMSELITLESRQSLEGLGLMRVSLRRDDAVPLRGFTALGLSQDEAWALLNELVKTVRMQGAVSLLNRVDIKDERFAPRNTRVRMRSTGSDRTKQIISWNPSGHPGTTNARITFLKKVLAALSNATPADKVLDGCWRLLEKSGYLVSEAERAGHVFQLDHNRLSLTSGLACDWYRCGTCRLTTAFSVRNVCPNSRCTGTLEPFAVPAPDSDTNHYRVTYQTMNTIPLSAREHTAQWDAKEAARIQRDFIAGQVNVLSCSTTFELGVDVGDLQSVVMRNMPPRTANYVQRAGRAGRRAASAALVVTYAKRAAHDLAQYQNPISMIAGQMRIPWVPTDNGRIARRHAHSIALAAYWRNCYDRLGQTWKSTGDFFTSPAEGQPSPAARVVEYLTPVPPQVNEALREALPVSVQAEIGLLDGSWVSKLGRLLAKAEKEIRDDIVQFNELIGEAVQKENYRLAGRLKDTLKTIKSRDLLGFLANRNILPKYGFPVDTVELRTLHAVDPIGRQLELDRDLSLAIYEYAPGNEVVAGGKVWTSVGLRKAPGRELDQFKYRICQNCQRFQCGRELDANEPCPSCQKPYGNERKLLLPEFGFVASRESRDVGTAPPERRWHGASYVEDPGEELATYLWSGGGGFGVKARAGKRATLAMVSDGTGEGFQVCQRCGWAQPVERGNRRKKHQHPETGKDCDGRIDTFSLGHRYQSDVAEFTFDAVAYPSDAEAIWLSTLYALLEGASHALEISRDDIDGAQSWSLDQRRSIVLFDTVPGGAGAAKRIAENIEQVLHAALRRVQDCDCGEETSCYGCLRSYRNARVHEKLSREAALKVLGCVTR